MANNKQIRPHDAGCFPFSLANFTASGLDVARNLAFKNCKNQFYFKGRQTVSKHKTTDIKEIQLVSFRSGNASAPGKFPDETNSMESHSVPFTVQLDFVETFCKTMAINLDDKSPSPCC